MLTFGEQFEYAGYWYESTPLAEIITVPGIALLLITCRAYSGPIAGVVRCAWKCSVGVVRSGLACSRLVANAVRSCWPHLRSFAGIIRTCLGYLRPIAVAIRCCWACLRLIVDVVWFCCAILGSVVVTGPPRADQVKKPSPVAGSRPVKRAAEPNGTMRSPGNRKKRRVAEPQAALVATATPVVITLTPQHAALAAHEDEALARSEEASGLEDGSDAPVSPAAIPTVAALVEKAPAPTDDDLPIPRTAGPVEVSPATATAPLPAAVVETSLVSADHGLPVTYRGRR